MRRHLIACCVTLLLAACTAPIRVRSAHIACGQAPVTAMSDTASLDIALDSAARTTISQVDLEVGGGAAARIQIDSLAVSCWSSKQGLRVSLSGAWPKPPYLQAGTGSPFARTTVHAGDTVLLDTILDMTGSVYRSISWPKVP
jgi:hypothetical protein